MFALGRALLCGVNKRPALYHSRIFNNAPPARAAFHTTRTSRLVDNSGLTNLKPPSVASNKTEGERGPVTPIEWALYGAFLYYIYIELNKSFERNKPAEFISEKESNRKLAADALPGIIPGAAIKRFVVVFTSSVEPI
jgi:hypothetical protein